MVAGQLDGSVVQQMLQMRNQFGNNNIVTFYKAWDEWGALSNFSPHPIMLSDAAVGADSSRDGSSSDGSSSSSSSGESREYASVEHFYQSQKFAGVDLDEARQLREQITAALSPEEAAALGRRAERQQPHLVRSDWAAAKRAVMLIALRAKFNSHAGPRSMLLSTAGDRVKAGQADAAARNAVWAGNSSRSSRAGYRGSDSSSSSSSTGGAAFLVESSPHDRFWGQGYDGLGQNYLGQLLMQVRDELLQQQQQQQQQKQEQHVASNRAPAHVQQQQQQPSVNGVGSSWPQQAADAQPLAG
jgi:diaminohydroxyphosphoribosylaminopyrimidine deaminase/5-amino-6-(5-phosphoribosylamino)uracil reductase